VRRLGPRPDVWGARALLALALAGGLACAPSPVASAGPPIVLVSLDTLRADHLTPYGYARATSPSLARFAGESVRFDAAHAHSTATLPSHISLLTSLLPPSFGITRAGEHGSQASTRLRLADPVVTLAQVLERHGYRTAAFTDGGYVHPFYGFDRGFEHFSVTRANEGAYWNGFRKSLGRMEDWLDELLASSAQPPPVFLFLHTYDIHEPYSAPKPFDRTWTDLDYRGFRAERGFEARPVELSRRRAELTARDVERVVGFYDNGIRATDQALGRLFAGLRKRGLYDDALIVVLSDHGEEFLDHGDFGHGPRVYQELARVPLLLRLPGGAEAGRAIAGPVGLIDVAPTLLDLAGLPIPASFSGRSLRAVISGDDDGAWLEERPLYVDAPLVKSDVAALRRGPWKLIRSGRRSELYHLGDDPGETRDLASRQPQRARALRRELDDWIAALRTRARTEGTLAVPSRESHPAEQAEALRALGYVE
jgi:arylsulfatase A-like enzyme